MCRTLAGWLLLAALLTPRLAAEEPQAAARSVRGVVRTAAGEPVDGAEVWIITTDTFVIEQKDLLTAKTASDGQFEFAVPQKWLDAIPRVRQELGIVAYRQGHALGGISLHRESSVPATQIEIVLPVAESAAVTILDPDGRPVSGAKVQVSAFLCDSIQVGVGASRARQVAKSWGFEPRSIAGGAIVGRIPILLPAALEERLSAVTDAQGRATIDAVGISRLASLTVEAAGFGRQRAARTVFGPTADEQALEKVQLGRPIPVTGQLIGQPSDVAGKSLRILGYGLHYHPSQVVIQVHGETKTDEQGRFSATTCEGSFYPYFDWDDDSPVRPAPPEQFQVKAGAKNHLEVPLEPAVKAFGYVKDASTGKGLSGVRVALFNSAWRGRPLSTDASGRYEATLAPSMTMVHAAVAPGYLPVSNQRQNEPQQVSAGSPEIKTILLARGAIVAGTVVDEAGKPVAGASVTATWYGYDPSVGHHDLIDETLTTDAAGRYEFRGIDPTSECRVWAAGEGAFSRGMTVVKGDQSSLTLEISSKNAVRISGRVLAAGGKPASGAQLEIWRRPWMPLGNEPEPERVALAGGANLTADDVGRFATPPLPPTAAYRISLVDSRYEPAHSAWADATGGKELPPAELLARTLGEHLGIVRDAAGKPVAGAVVEFRGGLSRAHARTDAAGRFSLKPAPDGPGLLFVAKEGFWFHGQRIESLGAPLEIGLAETDRAYGQKLAPTPPMTPLPERQKLAQQLFDELIKAAASDLTGQTRLRVLQKWAAVNPAAALEFVAKKPSLIPMYNDAVRFEAAKTLMHTAPDDALEAIESLGSGHMPVLLYVWLAAALPAENRERKLELLAEAHVKAQAIKEPGFRLIAIGQVAEGLLDLGERERGEKLLTENLETARKLNASGYDAYLRGAFAEELSQVDLDAALKLVGEITDHFEKTRHLANIAQEMAGVKPDEAEKILTSLEPPPEGSRIIDQRDHYIAIASYRMAHVDLPRATRLVASMTDPFHQAHARGLMAVALAKTDPPTSRELVRAAFGGLDDAAAKKPSELPISVGNFGNIGGWLVWHASRFDPELAAECRWRLLRLLPDVASADAQQRWRDVEALSSSALFLAEIDAPLARELLTRLDGDWQLAVLGSSRTWLPAWGLIDPAEAVKRAGEIDEQSRQNAKLTLLSALGTTGQARERLLHYQAGLWRIDVEDLDQ